MIKRAVHRFLQSRGYQLVPYAPEMKVPDELPPDFDPQTAATVAAVAPYTMTSPERIFALCEAVRYVVRNRIPGCVVECGVWRGGSMMAVARTLQELGETDRDLYLFDTFEGMPLPGAQDADPEGRSAAELYESVPNWCLAGVDEVREALSGTGYPRERLHFVQGMVEDTIPAHAPSEIALLRLDTDWYSSTRHEMVHLYPRVSPGGVVIFDDYGFWSGHRQAVDEYIQETGTPLLLNRIDGTGRIAVVPQAVPAPAGRA